MNTITTACKGSWIQLNQRRAERAIILLLFLTMPALVQAQFTYIITNGTVTITGYAGPGGLVVIPGTINGLPVTSIGNGAFQGYTIPMSVTIGTNVTSIGSSAFSSCSRLASVTIPKSVTSIGDLAFYDCTSLRGITVDTLNSAYSSVDGVLFNQSQATLIQYPAGKAGSAYTIPNSVASIRDYAFACCFSLTTAYFLGNAPSLGGPNVFYQDNNVTVYYLAGATGWGATFGGWPATPWDPQVSCAYAITNGTITITKYLGSGGRVDIPDAIYGLPVTSIGSNAFSGTLGW